MKVYILIGVLCLILSLLLFAGVLDKDFFSYYYIGREVILHNKDFFRDFAENKGIGTYLYFTILYSIFKDNWMAALVFSNATLDTIGIILTIIFVRGIRVGKTNIKFDHIVLIIVFVLVFKSCSIGTLLGGVYTTNVAYPLLIASLIFFQRKYFFWSGMFFAACVLTRQSFVFFAPVFLTIPFLYSFSFKKSLGLYVLGGITTLTLFLLYGIESHNLTWIYENMVLYAIHYANSPNAGNTLIPILIGFIYQPSFIAVFVYTSLMIGIFLKKFYKLRRLSLFVLIFFVCSIWATFSAGIFYFHHFLQFMPIFAFALAIQNMYWKRSWFFIAVIILSCTLVMWQVYTSIAKKYDWFIHIDNEIIQEKKYIQIIPYHPRYYFEFNKSSPDRYYNVFFLTPFSNTHYQNDATRHAAIPDSVLSQTAFLFIDSTPMDKPLSEEYLTYYTHRFNLKKVDQKQVGKIRILIYEANPK